MLRSCVAAIVIAASAAACKDTAEEPEQEPEVGTMRLTVTATGQATQTVEVSSTGTITGGPISLKVNTPTTITALFLKDDGTTEEIAMTDEFQLNVVQLTPATITMQRTSDFVVVLTGSATTTSGRGQFGLFHTAEQHFDFGEFTVPISVVP
jgi:hypothetical protein